MNKIYNSLCVYAKFNQNKSCKPIIQKLYISVSYPASIKFHRRFGYNKRKKNQPHLIYPFPNKVEVLNGNRHRNYYNEYIRPSIINFLDSSLDCLFVSFLNYILQWKV